MTTLPKPPAPGSPGLSHPQDVLAALLRNPSQPVRELGVGPEASEAARREALTEVRALVDRLLGRPIRKTPADDVPELSIVERLRFCWVLLRKAEDALRAKPRKGPASAAPHAIFAGLLGKKPPCPMRPSLCAAVTDVLDLGPAGDFLSAYRDFLVVPRGPVTLPLLDDQGHPLQEQVRRLLYWLARDERTSYVVKEPFRVQQEVLCERVLERFRATAPAEAAALPGLAELGREQVDRWLAYSCLTGTDLPADARTRRDLARYFISCNHLDEAPPAVDGADAVQAEAQVAALRAEVDNLRAEVRKLREAVPDSDQAAEADRLRAEAHTFRQEAETLRREAERLRQETAPTPGELRELQNLVRGIDEKYPLDTLHDIQMGKETSVGLRQFVMHLLLGLKRRGLVAYPEADEFDLPYNEAGLYDRLGVDVNPGEIARVVVQQKGWAFRHGRLLLPVRKARVRRTGSPVAGNPGSVP